MLFRKSLLVLASLISATLFAQNKVVPGNLSPIFDVSPDNENIVISISNGETSTLYIFSLKEDNLAQLTDSKGYYSRPVYSPKGDKIIFLSKNLREETSQLCSISLDNKEITKLTDGKTYVTEASYMPNGKEIIYCGAGTITNYSPLARKAPHELNSYSISQNGGNSKKLTMFNAYEFEGISPNQKGDSLLCKLMAKGAEGIYMISLSDTGKTKIEAVNNPRPEIEEGFYGTPAFSKDNKQISFTAPYQLYLLNLADKKCMEIWSTFGNEEQAMPIFSRFDGTNKKVFFSVIAIVNRQYSRSAQIYSFDFVTKKATQIFIPLTN